MLTVGSLFSGIGGLELGLERAGMRVLWQVEKDPYARRVLEARWPGVVRYDDVRNIGRHNLAPINVLCGGFPCQDISVAGKGAGIREGTRSGLWIEYARIIRELRPRYVLVENVPALRSRGLDRVLGDLAALGYDAEWECLPASAFGALHRRDRIYLVAYARGEFVRLESGRGRGADGASEALTAEHGEARSVADSDGARELQPRGPFSEIRRRIGDSGFASDAWTIEPNVDRVAHGVPARVDRLRCLGNAVVPQVAEFVGRCIVAHAA